MNPDDSYILQEGDEILVIAEDDDSYAPAELPMVLSFSSRNKDFKQISWFILLAYSVCCIICSTCIMWYLTYSLLKSGCIWMLQKNERELKRDE